MIYNLIGGGGKGLTPELIVTAPNGSTVTCNGQSPKSITVGATTTEYLFTNLSLGIQTVVSTLGARSKTEAITIDRIGQYMLTIVYSRLPEEYQEVEYISNATNINAYINTGIRFKYGHKLMWTSKLLSSTSYNGLFYSGTNRLGITRAGSKYELNYGSGNVSNMWTADDNEHYFYIDLEHGKIGVDDNEYTFTPSTSFEAALGFSFMARTRDYGADYSLAEIKEIISEYFGTIDHDLVPCYLKTDTTKHTAGLYDTVEDVFHGNSGTGYFEVGPDVYL